MDIFDWLIVLVVVGAAAALWLLYRKPNTVTFEGRAYRRRRDGAFQGASGHAVADPALLASLTAEHERRMKARDARIASAADD